MAPLPAADMRWAKRHLCQTLGWGRGGQGPQPACRCAQRSPWGPRPHL